MTNNEHRMKLIIVTIFFGTVIVVGVVMLLTS